MQKDNALYQRLDKMQRELDNLNSKVNDEQYSDRYKFFKQIIISRDTGKLIFEEKDSVPTTATLGELSFYNGRHYSTTEADIFRPLHTLPVRSIDAGVASDDAETEDGLIQCTTNSSQALTITHLEAADNIGQVIVYTFVTDGGQSVTVNRTGSDVFNDNGDRNNTSITLDDAGDSIALMAVQDNIWLVLNNDGCTLT